MSVRMEIRWPAGMVERIDVARGDVPRSVFVRRAVERALEPAEFFTTSPVPVEQRIYVDGASAKVRGSSQVKREVRPIPKGKP